MVVSLLYQLTRRLLSVPAVLLHHDTAKDAELVVLRRENAVLRHQITGQIRYEPADRFWFAGLSSVLPRRRWHDIFPIRPQRSWPGNANSSPGMGLQRKR
jgi:putative transposase